MSEVRLPPRLQQAIREFLERRGRIRPVGLKKLTKSARSMMTELPYDDGMLEDLLAEELIREGANIDFGETGAVMTAEDERPLDLLHRRNLRSSTH